MAYLFLYLGMTVIGFVAGSQLTRLGIALSWVGRVQTVMIFILVFLMGSRIGANKEIVASLDTIGLVSLAYTMIIFVVTVLASTIARRLLGFDRYGVRRDGRTPAKKAAPGAGAPAAVEIEEAGACAAVRTAGADEQAGAPANTEIEEAGACAAARTAGADGQAGAPTTALEPEHEPEHEPDQGEAKSSKINWMTVFIVVFVAFGIFCGYTFLPESFIAVTGTLLTISLCILLVFIGVDIGTAGTLGKNFRNAGWRVLVFPFVSIIGMAAGSVVAAMLLPLSVQDALCVGSGFAWYSLAPVMLAEYSVRISAISFMHNVFREVLGMLLVPVAARFVGYIECYSLPGSVSMDVCLPIIERSTNSDVAVYSFINGAIISATVPFQVTFFMNL